MFFEGVALVVPDVAGGTDRVVGGAVFVLEVVGFIDADRAVVVVGCGGDGEATGLVVEGFGVAFCGVGPVAFGVGHEADFKGAVAVVETGDGDGAVHLLEGCGESDFGEGVALLGAG